MKDNQPVQPYMENDRVIIHGLDDSDLENLTAMREDSRIYRYEPTYLPELQGTPEEALAHLKRLDLHKDRQCVLGIYDKQCDNAFVGLAEFYDFKLSGKIVSLGCRLIPEYWGKGLASSCTEAMLDYLREHTKVNLITAHAIPDNKASAQCLQGLGFHYLLTKPEDWGRGGLTVSDVYTMHMHMPSLKEAKDKFEKRHASGGKA